MQTSAVNAFNKPANGFGMPRVRHENRHLKSYLPETHGLVYAEIGGKSKTVPRRDLQP
jgi:hypothetical protein